jgi:hypothetical protein
MPAITVGLRMSASRDRETHVTASVAEQLAEVYALADELHELTDRIKSKVDSVIATLPPRMTDSLEPTDGLGAVGAEHDSPLS